MNQMESEAINLLFELNCVNAIVLSNNFSQNIDRSKVKIQCYY